MVRLSDGLIHVIIIHANSVHCAVSSNHPPDAPVKSSVTQPSPLLVPLGYIGSVVVRPV